MQNGELIATLRSMAGITQQEMASKLQVSLSTYKRYENNLRTMKLYELNFLSNFFKVTIDRLLNLTKENLYYNVNERINYRALSFNLKKARQKNNLTQRQLALMLKVAPSTVSRYESKPHSISIPYLCIYVKKFNASVDFICGKTLVNTNEKST